MSPSPRPARRRRRFTTLRITAGLGLIGASLFVGTGTSGAEDPAGPRADEDACATVTSNVQLIGSTTAREAIIGWGADVCAKAKVVADYTDFGSYGGREAVIPADAEVIGLTSLPFSKEEQEALKEEQRGVVLVPMLGSAVACTYWDTNPSQPNLSGTRFPDLRISRRTLADQLGGSPRESTNASADLVEDNKDNPSFSSAPPYLNIEPWFRSGYSAVTHRLTEWFDQDEQATEDFLKGSFLEYQLPFEDIGTPDGSSPQLINDYATMKSRLLGSLQAIGLGCMDNASARTDAKPETEKVDALNIAWLDNAEGAFVAPTDDAISRGLEAMTPNADGTYSVDWELEDDKAYPLPLVVYAAMPTCGISPETKVAMNSVMSYALGDGQKKLPAGNVELPDDMAATAQRQLTNWRNISKAEACDGSSTTTTQPPTTTTTPNGETPSTTAFVPFDDGSGGGSFAGGTGGSGVVADPGFTGTGATGGTTGEAAAGDGTTATGDDAGGGGDAVAAVVEPDGPLRRVVAVATGASSIPPGAMLLMGGALLIAGPVLQIFGGLKRSNSLPSAAVGWFGRLRP
jgi:ABC-type phosphate transport system substrate-binding protein